MGKLLLCLLHFFILVKTGIQDSQLSDLCSVRRLEQMVHSIATSLISDFQYHFIQILSIQLFVHAPLIQQIVLTICYMLATIVDAWGISVNKNIGKSLPFNSGIPGFLITRSSCTV